MSEHRFKPEVGVDANKDAKLAAILKQLGFSGDIKPSDVKIKLTVDGGLPVFSGTIGGYDIEVSRLPDMPKMFDKPDQYNGKAGTVVLTEDQARMLFEKCQAIERAMNDDNVEVIPQTPGDKENEGVLSKLGL